MSRYLEAYKTYKEDALLRLAPDGHCQWCGKQFPKRCRVFCPSIEKGMGMGYTYRIQKCAVAYFHLWQSIPRFKRVVYVRDNFTCQLCGVKPEIKNLHSLVMPDFGQLCIDHIYPYAKGGSTKPDNLQVACRKCNLKKRDKLDYAPQGELALET